MRAFNSTSAEPKFMGPVTEVIAGPASMATPRARRQSIIASVSSHLGMPLIWLVPSTKALIASWRSAIDLLPGSVMKASNPRDNLGIKKVLSGIMGELEIVVRRHFNSALIGLQRLQ